MAIKRTSHAVYDTSYHLVWCPKYWKKIFSRGDIRERAEHLIREISEEYGFEIVEIEVAVEHIDTYKGSDVSSPMPDISSTRLAAYMSRVKLTQADLINEDWGEKISQPVGTIISTWTLHDLGSRQKHS